MIKSRGLHRVAQDFKLHPLLHIVSTTTIAVALTFLGGILLVSRNFSEISRHTTPNATGTVYLQEGLTVDQLDKLTDELVNVNGVEEATFKGRDQVWQELKGFLGAMDYEAPTMKETVPDIVELKVRPGLSASEYASLKGALARFPEIMELDFSENWLEQVQKLKSTLEILSWTLIVAIIIGCGFVLANLMGMRHQSRKQEIDIVRLIGAHQRFILIPFVWEAVIEGLLGSGLAIGILSILHQVLGSIVAVQGIRFTGIPEWYFLSVSQIGALFGAGILIAFFGSFTLFLRFREVR